MEKRAAKGATSSREGENGVHARKKRPKKGDWELRWPIRLMPSYRWTTLETELNKEGPTPYFFTITGKKALGRRGRQIWLRLREIRGTGRRGNSFAMPWEGGVFCMGKG